MKVYDAADSDSTGVASERGQDELKRAALSTPYLAADNALDDRHQLTDVHRLDDMIEKTHFPATPLILAHAITAQGDAFDSVTIARLFHQVVAGPAGSPRSLTTTSNRSVAASCSAVATLLAVLTV